MKTIGTLLLLWIMCLTAGQIFAQGTVADTHVGGEEFNEEDLYDDERDAELDSLRQVVEELQTSVSTTEERYTDDAIWGDRAKYFNIAYVMQDLKVKNFDYKWDSDLGVALAFGKTFYLHRKPILNMIKFGIDWSYIDINFAKFQDKQNFFYGDDDYYYPYYDIESVDMYQAEIGTAIGPSVTVNPYNHLKVNAYFRVEPSFSALYADEDFNCSYATFLSVGGAVSYKVISVGVEWRWGTSRFGKDVSGYDGIDWDTIDDETYDRLYDEAPSMKWKTSSLRFYISFRYWPILEISTSKRALQTQTSILKSCRLKHYILKIAAKPEK